MLLHIPDYPRQLEMVFGYVEWHEAAGDENSGATIPVHVSQDIVIIVVVVVSGVVMIVIIISGCLLHDKIT